jgi:hypothetical protein
MVLIVSKVIYFQEDIILKSYFLISYRSTKELSLESFYELNFIRYPILDLMFLDVHSCNNLEIIWFV